MKTSYLRITLLACLSVIAGLPIRPTPVLAAQSITVDDMMLGVIGKSEFDAGYAQLLNHPIYRSSTVDWDIFVCSLDPDLGMSTDGLYTKSLADLRWKLSSGSSWTPMTQIDTEVTFGYDTGPGVTYIDVRVLLNWVQDRPGSYQADLLFTIAPL
jgi:hypothetical protein